MEEKVKVDDPAHSIDAECKSNNLLIASRIQAHNIKDQRNMSYEVDNVKDNVQALQLDMNAQFSTLAYELGTLNDKLRGLHTGGESREIRKCTLGLS